MAEQTSSDLIMMFMKDRRPVLAESSTELKLKSSDLTKGFQPGGMFEVQSFSMKTGLDPDDDEASGAEADQAVYEALRSIHDQLSNIAPSPGANAPAPAVNRALERVPGAIRNKGSGFKKWRSGMNSPPMKAYAVDMDPFEFTRFIDKASGVFWKNCIDRITYDSATLIKRKAAGGSASGDVFLRLDFTKVLMIGIDWDQDEPIKEKCKFISRAVTLHYRPQLPDGSLGAAKQAFWTMNPGKYQAVNLKGR